MRKLFILLLLGIISCSVVDQNIKARTSLSKCKYDVEKLEFDKVVILDDITIDGNDIKDVKSAAISVLTKVLPKVMANDFEVKVDKVFFNSYVSIENTTDNEVALDHFIGEVLIDGNKVFDFKHDKFTRIKPKEKTIETINISVPFDSIKIKKPEKIGIKVTFYMNIMIGGVTLKDLFKITVQKDFPIPYDKINQLINQAKDKVINIIKERVQKEAGKGIEKVKSLIK